MGKTNAILDALRVGDPDATQGIAFAMPAGRRLR